MRKVIFIDAGHGHINPKTKKYTTAPGKMFKHPEYTFYEGVKNRVYCDILIKKLVAEGIKVIPVYHEWKDTSLSARTAMANWYHENIQEGIYISEHSNATPQHTARGFQVWTSPGKTKSDVYAQKLIDLYKANNHLSESGQIRVLEDLSDGDSDYEAKFHVLTKTKMPAILLENLFFDNPKDASVLMSDWYQQTYTDILVEWIKQII